MIARKDLAEIGDENRHNEYVLCSDCGEQFGGTRGDYFMQAMDTPFTCPCCKSTNLALAVNVTTIRIIKQ